MSITGAALFVEALKKEKVKILFGYPGGQAINVLPGVSVRPASGGSLAR